MPSQVERCSERRGGARCLSLSRFALGGWRARALALVGSLNARSHRVQPPRGGLLEVAVAPTPLTSDDAIA
jgi:hypothetical protein